MSYDPPRPPRHRATPPYQAPAGNGGPPWATQTYQEQPGYADAFDNAQAYGGMRAPAGYDGYPSQDGYYADQDGYYADQSGYPDQNGYPAQSGYAGQGGFDNYPAAYSPPAGYESPVGYQDPRSSGPMLSAPDQTSWDGFGDDLDRPPASKPAGMLAGAVMGFVAAGASIGIATLAAAFFRPQASPIIAVGEWFIDRTPSWLKNFAVAKFGEHDKTMLLLGMYFTIAALAIGIGILARRRTTVGVVGVAVFGMFGAYIAYTRPESRFSDIIPSIIGGIAGVAALLWLARAAAADPATGQEARGRAERAGRHGNPRVAGGWS